MTVRFVADENFNRRIVTRLQRRVDDLDVVRVQGIGLLSADDPASLAIGEAIEDLALVAEASLGGEWGGQVRYLPLR